MPYDETLEKADKSKIDVEALETLFNALEEDLSDLHHSLFINKDAGKYIWAEIEMNKMIGYLEAIKREIGVPEVHNNN